MWVAKAEVENQPYYQIATSLWRWLAELKAWNWRRHNPGIATTVQWVRWF